MGGDARPFQMGVVRLGSAPEGSTNVLGVHIHRLTMDDLISKTVLWAQGREPRTVMYANVHVLNTAYGDPGLCAILNGADLVYCDGEGVRRVTRMLGQALPERITGADWLLPLCIRCESEGIGVFFLGSEPGVSARAVEIINESCPQLRLGSHHGYLTDSRISESAIALANASESKIVLVGMGTPIQEKWIAAHRTGLRAPVVWAVGALFDFVAGVQHRGPRWMVDHGLEWLHRLWSDPKRLGYRYLIGNPLFVLRVLRQRWHIHTRSGQ